MSTVAGWYPGDGAVVRGLEVLAVATAVVGLAWAADRGRRAAWRVGLWSAALVGVLLAPAAVLVGPRLPWRFAMFRPAEAAAEPPPTVGEEVGAGDSLPSTESAGLRTPSPTPSREGTAGRTKPAPSLPAEVAPATTPPSASSTPTSPAEPPASEDRVHVLVALVALAWGLGTAYLAARVLHGAWRVSRLLKRSRPLDQSRWAAELDVAARALAVERLPAVCSSSEVRGPVVAGLFPPRVVLPESLPEQSTPEQLVAVLVHECAHVVRRDHWVRLLQRLAAALYWPHPLVHLLNRRLDRAREEVCDNHVLAYTDAPSYAEALLTVAQACYPTPRLEGYLTMMPRQYPLERRVADLLEERRDTATRLPATQRVALMTLVAVILSAAASIGLRGAPAMSAEDAPSRREAGEKLTGQVVGAAGKPAAGAVVWAASLESGPPERVEAVTDAGGNYSLELRPGSWLVWARKGTQGGDHGEPVVVVARQAPAGVPLRLEERGTFRGRLLEAESGKPIPGGRLHLDVGVTLTADAAGRFELGGLSRAHHEAFVLAPGRRRMRVLFDTTGKAETELDVPVPRGAKVVGRVTDLNGRPIPRAYVGYGTSGSTISIRALMTACDKDGRFEYDGVTPGPKARLTAYGPGFIADERTATTPADGKPAELTFRLRPKPGTPAGDFAPGAEKQRPVSGVVKRPDGKPAVGVLVRWGYRPYVGATEVRTDAEGRFRMVVPDKANMLAVLPADYPPEFPRVAEGGKKEVEVTLKPGKTVRGKVSDEDGKPLRNVWVIAQTRSPDPRIGNPFWLNESATHTDPEGRFEVKGVPEWARFDFLRRDLSDLRGLELDPGKADNVVKMPYGGALFGRVVGRDGKPIRSFRVLVGFPRDRKPGDKTEGYFAGYSGIGVRFTSDDGTFVLTGVGAGCVYRVKALADGHGEAVGERVVSVPINRLANTKPTTLTAGPPVKFRVRAVGPGGKPIPDARVTLVDGQDQLDTAYSWEGGGWEDTVSGLTGPDGWADFPSLTFGAATVLIRAPGHARHRVGWRKKEKELTCEISAEAVLTGEVVGPDGKPVRGCYVVVNGDGHRVVATVAPEDKGRFRLPELPATMWRVEVYGADGQEVIHRRQLTLKAGETKELAIKTEKE